MSGEVNISNILHEYKIMSQPSVTYDKIAVQSVFLILTIGPAGHVPESSSGWVVSAAGQGWSSHVDISAARNKNTLPVSFTLNNLQH